MEKMKRMHSRWLEKIPDRVLMDRIEALAAKNGCWVRVWENPCCREGVLFWIETYADGDAAGREESFRSDWDTELYNWFLIQSKEN